MGVNSNIEWTDATFNPWRGCTKVSAGCANCYADTLSKRNPGVLGVWGPNGTRVVAAEAQWALPVKWNRDAGIAFDKYRCGGGPNKPPYERPRVFCASLSDVFEGWQGDVRNSAGQKVWATPNGVWMASSPIDFHGNPIEPDRQPNPDVKPLTMQDVRSRLFALIDATPNLNWLVLTKRPENIARMMPEYPTTGGVHPNLWLGVSVENQHAAAERIPHLLKVPAKVRFLSCEPLLSAVDLSPWLVTDMRAESGGISQPNQIHWVIAGGESGPNARPMNPAWARSIRDQCVAVGVAFHFKQWGEYGPEQTKSVAFTPVYSGVPMDPPAPMFRVGKVAAGRTLDGRTWDEVPT